MSYIGNQPTSVAFLTDQFSGTGSQTAFTMSVAPANTASVLVAVSGVLQAPDTYSVSGTTLTFSAAPPSGTGNVSARYLGIPASGVTNTAYRTVTEFTATAGQTTFTPPSYTAGYISVYRNGVMLGSADYTATNGTTVVLATGATAGDLITTESFYISSVLNAIPATAGAVTSTYLNTGAALANIGAGGVTQSYLGSNVAGNGPAFSAYPSASSTTISSSTWTKVTLDTEVYDTNSNFASSRFTPTVAGYYQINFTATGSSSASNGLWFGSAIYKNGTLYVVSFPVFPAGNVQQLGTALSQLIYMNGSTDYIEFYVNVYVGSGTANYGGTTGTMASGYLARAA